MTTVIRNASWIAAWDERQGGHVYQRHGDVAFDSCQVNLFGSQFTVATTQQSTQRTFGSVGQSLTCSLDDAAGRCVRFQLATTATPNTKLCCW